jgi:hypothetical protein
MTTIMTWVPRMLDLNGGKVPVDIDALIKEVQRSVGNAANVRVIPSLKGTHIYFDGITYHHADFRDKINFMDTHREHNILKRGPFIMADFMGTFKVRFVVASDPPCPISIYIPHKGNVVIVDSPIVPGVGITLVAPYVPRNLNPYRAIDSFAAADKVIFYPRSPNVSRVVFEGVRFKQNATAIKDYFEQSKSNPSPSGIYVYLSPTSYLVIAAMRTPVVVGGTNIPTPEEPQDAILIGDEDDINFDM